jgi:hypothetical protein
MAEQIADGTGNAYLMKVNSDGSINVSGVDITIGSLALSLESIYIQSGNNLTGSFYPLEPSPLMSSNNPQYKFIYLTSGASTGVTGSSIGSIYKYVGTDAYVQVFTYDNDYVVNLGSWIGSSA